MGIPVYPFLESRFAHQPYTKHVPSESQARKMSGNAPWQPFTAVALSGYARSSHWKCSRSLAIGHCRDSRCNAGSCFHLMPGLD